MSTSTMQGVCPQTVVTTPLSQGIKIALTGYKDSGKSVVAQYLSQKHGIPFCAFGSIIKRLIRNEFVGCPSSFRSFMRWWQDKYVGSLETSNPISTERLAAVNRGSVLCYSGAVDPFVPNGPIKDSIREFLEEYGEWRYDWLTHLFFTELPQSAINERLCRLNEAKLWKEQGGVIWLVDRPGNKPASEWEEQIVVDLHKAGYIDAMILNNGTNNDWEQCLKSQVKDLFDHFFCGHAVRTPHQESEFQSDFLKNVKSGPAGVINTSLTGADIVIGNCSEVLTDGMTTEDAFSKLTAPCVDEAITEQLTEVPDMRHESDKFREAGSTITFPYPSPMPQSIAVGHALGDDGKILLLVQLNGFGEARVEINTNYASDGEIQFLITPKTE